MGCHMVYGQAIRFCLGFRPGPVHSCSFQFVTPTLTTLDSFFTFVLSLLLVFLDFCCEGYI